MTAPRCEPPEELRGFEGPHILHEPAHGVRERRAKYRFLDGNEGPLHKWTWCPRGWYFYGSIISAEELFADGWRYSHSFIPRAVIEAEVEALRVIKARVESGEWLTEAAEACSGAWRAAPNGEGVAGAEGFAEEAARLVLLKGIKAPEAVARAIGNVGTYGVRREYELVRRDELAALRAAAGDSADFDARMDELTAGVVRLKEAGAEYWRKRLEPKDPTP